MPVAWSVLPFLSDRMCQWPAEQTEDSRPSTSPLSHYPPLQIERPSQRYSCDGHIPPTQCFVVLRFQKPLFVHRFLFPSRYFIFAFLFAWSKADADSLDGMTLFVPRHTTHETFEGYVWMVGIEGSTRQRSNANSRSLDLQHGLSLTALHQNLITRSRVSERCRVGCVEDDIKVKTRTHDYNTMSAFWTLLLWLSCVAASTEHGLPSTTLPATWFWGDVDGINFLTRVQNERAPRCVNLFLPYVWRRTSSIGQILPSELGTLDGRGSLRPFKNFEWCSASCSIFIPSSPPQLRVCHFKLLCAFYVTESFAWSISVCLQGWESNGCTRVHFAGGYP